ncbi:MAG: hypothetical protein SNH13_06455 [Rikenellaceae bacterium]
MTLKRLYLIAVIIASVWSIRAQESNPPKLSATISPDSIMIGDRFYISIDIEKDVMQMVSFPEFDIPEGESIEVIEAGRVDTIKSDGRRVHLKRRYTLASFDEGNYNLGTPGVVYLDKNITDTLYTSDSLRLHVATFLIDSTSHPIFDIKGQRNLPFKFAEISGYLKWGLIIALILIAIGYAVYRILKHYSIGGIFKSPPPVPPHVAAISALEALHNQKLWQNNQHKLYYSTLTDIIRTYINGRYGIAAMEMTSDEIMAQVRTLDIPKKCAAELRELLTDSDQVKFAKATPEANQNEDYYNAVYYFVEETKEQDPETEQDHTNINEGK